MSRENDFLYQIARAYADNCCGGLRGDTVCFVVPNRRCEFILGGYLAELFPAGPRPTVKTLTWLILSINKQKQLPPLTLQLLLYRAYLTVLRRHAEARGTQPLPEEFDRFRFWGEMLLRDFDEVDRYMVPVHDIFKNVKDYKEIQSTYLTDEHRDIIRTFWHEDPYGGTAGNPAEKFWTHIGGDSNDGYPARPQARFVALWEILPELYREFESLLNEHGGTYVGKAYRRCAGLLRSRDAALHHRRYVFAGFNRLSTSEHMIMQSLLDMGKADFYWDYDPVLMNPADGNHAGRFICEYIKAFPSAYTLALTPAQERKHRVDIIGVPSNVGQAKLAARFVTADSALVLPDQETLPAVLTSLPERPDGTPMEVNVTMGYPLRHSLTASLFGATVRMQLRLVKRINGETEFFRDDVMALLSDSILTKLHAEACQAVVNYMAENHTFNLPASAFTAPDCGFAELRPVFTPVEADAPMEQMAAYVKGLLEFIGRSAVGRLEEQFLDTLATETDAVMAQARQCSVDMKRHTFFRLLENALFRQPLTLDGNSGHGLQVMGVLETRALSFAHVVMLSMTDRIYPGRLTTRSFIPDALRRGFGLPTAEHQEASMAYYFYRLLSHADHVQLLFDARAGGLRSGEMSRYLYQLRFLDKPNVEVSYQLAGYTVTPPEADGMLPADHQSGVAKTESVMESLNRFRSPECVKTNALSASSLKDYISCPLEFYLKHVAGIKTPDPMRNFIDEGTYGTIIHEVAQRVYEEISAPHAGMITDADLRDLRSPKGLELVGRHIRRAINLHYYKLPATVAHPTDPESVVANPELSTRPLEGEAQFIAKAIQHIFLTMADHEPRPFRFLAGEKRSRFHWTIMPGVTANFTMSIDRLDEVTYPWGDTVTRLVDYKSGSDSTTFRDVDELFDFNGRNTKGIFQLMTYCCAYADENALPDTTPLQPIIYPLGKVATDGLPNITLGKADFLDFRPMEPDFRRKLADVVAEIFNPEVPFYRSDNEHSCKYCDFKRICGVKDGE